MATKLGMKRTTPQLSLRRTKKLKQISTKSKVALRKWLTIKALRIIALQDKYGYVPCEYCHVPIFTGNELLTPEGHHNDGNRRHNYPDNCRILHRMCNQLMEDNNIKNVESLL